jgi:hypothetical protein
VVRWDDRGYCCNCVLLCYRRHPKRLGAIRRDGFHQRELLAAWHSLLLPGKGKPHAAFKTKPPSGVRAPDGFAWCGPGRLGTLPGI